MDLGFNDQQKMLKATAREFLEAECPTGFVREMESNERGYSPELWGKMADLGWLGLAFPPEYGGDGGNVIDQIALSEEIGRAILPSPFLTSSVLCGRTILHAANQEQQSRLLPQMGRGDLMVTLALAEAGGWIAGVPEAVTAAPSDGAFIINGTKLFVPYASVADLVLVAAKTDAGMTLFLVDRNAPGVTMSPLDSTAEYRQFEVQFRDVRIGNETIVGAQNDGWSSLAQAIEWATVVQCAEMVGRTEKVLEMTVEYANFRMAFGRPIATFQAVQHHCANLKVAVEGARMATQQAAWQVAEGLPASEQVSIAKAFAGDASRLGIEVGHAVFAGISFTVEHDLQLYTTRSKVAEANLGDTDFHLAKVSEHMAAGAYTP